MILPYGPVPLTAGIVTFQDVDSGAAWVVVENVSTQLYLGVSFWPSKPPAVKTFQGQPWNAVIQPGGTLRIECPKQVWLGRIWLLGVDASSQSAATGTISGYSSALLRTYGPDDTASDSPSVVRGLDILSQPRMINIPMTPFACYSNSLLGTAGTDVFPAPASFVAIMNPPTVTNCQVYIYYAQVNPTGVDGNMTFSVRLYARDGLGTILASQDVLNGWCGKTGNAGEPWLFAPANPWHVEPQSVPLGTVTIDVGVHVFASPAAWPFDFTIMADSDISTPGLVTVPGIGGGLNPDMYTGNQPKF